MFEHHRADLSQASLHYVTAGDRSRDPVVLLHGWPQTWHSWRRLIPLLVDRHFIVAPDLRGLGDSARPADGYDSASVAADVAELAIERLGLDRFHLVGHDWGGPTAFALACAHPRAVRTLTLIDVAVPGLGPDFSQGGLRWHHAFHRTPELPEALVQGRERIYLSWFYREYAWVRDAITETDVDEYVRCYAQPGAMRAGFGYYRALPVNVERNQALRASGFRLPMPVLGIGGGRAESRGRGSEPELSLREIADDVSGAVIADSGHFVPEEQPRALADALQRFFAGR
jgi:pimeloyl-ACP methyl ester carboxylesterase